MIFLDLAKAFDSIDRKELIMQLYDKQVDHTLVNAIRALYS